MWLYNEQWPVAIIPLQDRIMTLLLIILTRENIYLLVLTQALYRGKTIDRVLCNKRLARKEYSCIIRARIQLD